MNIFIRADSGYKIGTGHVMRMLYLASYLRGTITFISKNFEGNAIDKIKAKYPCEIIEYDNDTISEDIYLGESVDDDLHKTINILKRKIVNILIIDSYGINKSWESQVKKYTNKIMVVDDYIDREHYCDYYLNYHYDDPKLFKHIDSELFLGTDYFIINPSFLKKNDDKVIHNNKTVINISFGGSDFHNLTENVLDNIYSEDYNYEIILGLSNINTNNIMTKYSSYENVKIYHNTNDIKNILSKADICIGGGGVMLYEKCYLGKVCLVVTIADNQIELTKKLTNDNYVIYCGHYIDDYINAIKLHLKSDIVLNKMIFNNRILEISDILYQGSWDSRN